jgi:hypothetical protein
MQCFVRGRQRIEWCLRPQDLSHGDFYSSKQFIGISDLLYNAYESSDLHYKFLLVNNYNGWFIRHPAGSDLDVFDDQPFRHDTL